MTLADLTAIAGSYAAVDAEQFIDRTLPDAPVEDGRVLIVDDDPHAAKLMRRLIEREGFTHVAAVGDGRRALDMIMDHPPDVVVLDAHLPQVDGFAVLREIVRSDERTGRPTGVLGISGDATPATGQSMLWAGADDFIPRPFEAAEFTLRVRRIATRTRSLRRALSYSQFLEGRIHDLANP
ncbi:MAG: two-component system response regulator [Acidimicrobiia bacterium]